MGRIRTSGVAKGSLDDQIHQKTDTLCLADYPMLIAPLFEARGVGAYLAYFMTGEGERSGDQAYHCKEHMFQVALNCYEGGLYSGATASELKVLLVAGLFHDYGHARGAYSDRVNIPIAQEALRNAHNASGEHQRLTPVELRQALLAIGSTAYPYKSKPTTLIDKVLRDADVMTVYTQDKALRLKLIQGLYHEANVSNYRCESSIAEFIAGQLRFGSMIVWNTQWAKLKAMKRNFPAMNKQVCEELACQSNWPAYAR